MISARNYAAQAEREIVKTISSLPPYKHQDIDVRMCKLIVGLIKGAVHFAIPDNGEIFDDDLKGLSGIKARLPYPQMTIEYFVEKKQQYSELAPLYAPKRLVVAVELKQADLFRLHTIAGIPIADYFKLFPDEEFIQAVVLNEIGGVWIPCPMSWFLPVTWDYSADGELQLVSQPLLEENATGNYFAGSPVPILPGLFNLRVDRVGREKALQETIHDIAGEVRAVLELCEALACSNVTTETLQHESKGNAKRVRKGKLPIYETKTLSVEVPKTSKTSGVEHGDRRSPRQHLRRGHIRILKDDRRIWVNSCVVGSLGLGRIDKNYIVSKA